MFVALILCGPEPLVYGPFATMADAEAWERAVRRTTTMEPVIRPIWDPAGGAQLRLGGL